ncbi:MAG: sulfite exporter TauE/SafE family protein [Proteobacteria bacterium]|nr:sulfite exporter TauE/SafE family protein [Pseudomonadota bacterium]
MQIYLPIAEVSIDLTLLIALGGGVGVLSGLFGVGGGFLITPLLILIGIPPAVAVATGANQVAGASFSGVLVHWRRRAVDVKMGLVLMTGGLAGAAAGVRVFAYLRDLGQVDLVVSLCYVVMLGAIGALMLIEGVRALRRAGRGAVRRRRRHGWVHGLPFKMRFRASNLYISAIPPLVIGAMVGVLSAIMGVGGGFIMVPAMIYLLGMATNVVVGTSLFQILFVTAATTLMHAITSHTVDAILAVLLLLGGVIGAQVGARLAPRMKAEQMRVALALLVLVVCLEIGLGLVRDPGEVFIVVSGRAP